MFKGFAVAAAVPLILPTEEILALEPVKKFFALDNTMITPERPMVYIEPMTITEIQSGGEWVPEAKVISANRVALYKNIGNVGDILALDPACAAFGYIRSIDVDERGQAWANVTKTLGWGEGSEAEMPFMVAIAPGPVYSSRYRYHPVVPADRVGDIAARARMMTTDVQSKEDVIGALRLS